MNAYERAQTKVLRVSGATVHKQATKAKVARPDRACPRYREEKSPVLQLKNRARRSRNAPYDTLTLMTPYVISDLRQSHGTPGKVCKIRYLANRPLRSCSTRHNIPYTQTSLRRTPITSDLIDQFLAMTDSQQRTLRHFFDAHEHEL